MIPQSQLISFDVSNTVDVILSFTSQRGSETVGIMPTFWKQQFEINAFEIYVRITTIPFHISFFFSYRSKIQLDEATYALGVVAGCAVYVCKYIPNPSHRKWALARHVYSLTADDAPGSFKQYYCEFDVWKVYIYDLCIHYNG